jgi:hypothetical protein
METPDKVPLIVGTPVAPVKRPRIDDGQVPVNTGTALTETAQAEDALKRMRAVAKSMSVRYERAFLDSPEFRSALATYHMRRAKAETDRLFAIAKQHRGIMSFA